MSTKFEIVMSHLVDDPYFQDFKFRKRDSSFIRKTKYGKDIILLDHWINRNFNKLEIFPVYMVRFDILRTWFEKFSFKTLKIQRDGAYVAFSGVMLGFQDKFLMVPEDSDFASQIDNLKENLRSCSSFVFSEYSTLEKAYERKIKPLLDRTGKLPDIGADWFFENLTLCRIMHPERYEEVKRLHLKYAEEMHKRKEPNMEHYYERLDEILSYMEGLNLKI